MNLVFAFVLILCTGSAHADQASWKHFTEEAIEKGEALASGLKSSLKSSSGIPNLLILGENHTPGNYALYPAVFSRIESALPETDCLFLEMSSEMAQAVDRYRKNEIDFYGLSAEESELRGLQAPNPAFFEDRHGFQKTPLEEGIRLGWKLIPVDRGAFGKNEDRAHTIQGMNARNAEMAHRIAKSFQDGTCHRGVFVVGIDHLKKSGTGLAPVQKDLLDQGMESYRMGFLDRFQPGCASCKKAIADLESPLFVESGKLSGKTQSLTLEFPGEADGIGPVSIGVNECQAWFLF